jgi:uncharacterized protein (UPF0276 family)
MSEILSFKKKLDVGLGLRPEHYAHVLEELPPVSWFEVISENYMGIGKLSSGKPIQILEKIRENYPIVFHGVSLSIGSVDPLNFQYLESLKILINRFTPEWVSDHICWTGVHGENLHDLLPLPYTKETIDHLVGRIQQVQEFLGQRFIFENVSSYISYTQSEMSEWEFISEITRRSGCGLLLDVNNIYVSSVNHGFDASKFLNGVPKNSVVQMHLAGYSDHGNYLLDAHDSPVSDPVWALYREACEIFGAIPTLIEWDAEIPSFQILFNEAKKAKKIQEEFIVNDSRIQAAT